MSAASLRKRALWSSAVTDLDIPITRLDAHGAGFRLARTQISCLTYEQAGALSVLVKIIRAD